MYTKNNNGPKIDPRGTPYSIILSDALVLVIETNCFLSCKYDSNKGLATPQIP